MATDINKSAKHMSSHPACVHTLSEDFRLAWLRLARTKNVGAKTFVELIKMYGNPQKAIDNIGVLAGRGGASNKRLVPSKASIEKEMIATQKYGAKIILSCDSEYPTILTHIPDLPAVLIAKGNVDLLSKRMFAIVGARNSTINGNKLAYNFAKVIANGGYVVVSGLAKGIDSYAHKGSLDGGTIAVIAGGIDNIYPKENHNLYEAIYDKGLVITEQPIYSTVMSQHFPQRNRIIAGLSLGVLVIEATKRSGTLITSRFALEYNKEVYAVPGSPLDSKAQGTNELLKNGANIALSPDSIVKDLDYLTQKNLSFVKELSLKFMDNSIKSIPSEDDLRLHRGNLLRSLSHSPISIGDIVDQLDIPINILNCLLIELELAGKVQRLAGDKVCLVA
jgi:DNA processing protein